MMIVVAMIKIGSLALTWSLNARMIYKHAPSMPELTKLLGLVALTVSTPYRRLATNGRGVQDT